MRRQKRKKEIKVKAMPHRSFLVAGIKKTPFKKGVLDVCFCLSKIRRTKGRKGIKQKMKTSGGRASVSSKSERRERHFGWGIKKVSFVFPLCFGWGLAVVKIRKRILWPFKKHWQEVVALLLLISIVASGLFFRQTTPSLAATYYWVQTDWSGGATTTTAVHPTNQTGWTKFYEKDDNIDDGTVGQIGLSTSTSKVWASDADWNTGVELNVNHTEVANQLQLNTEIPARDCVDATDHNSENWTPANESIISGKHCNVATFTIAAGTTVYVGEEEKLKVYADNISILGTLNGDQKGYAGGDGSYISRYSGYGGTGEGAGSRSNSEGVYKGPSGACYAGGSAGGTVSGGGAGAGGAGYGGAGGVGGTGGKAGYIAGIGLVPGGSAGPAYGSSTSYAIEMGSGAGGGGSGGFAAGTADWTGGTAGGRGGTGIFLDARDGTTTISGIVTVNGGNGGNGGKGDNAQSTNFTPPAGENNCGAGGAGGGGGGSGGGILISGTTVIISGTVRANGGSGGSGGSGGTGYAPGEAGGTGQSGGGGRIKIFYSTSEDITGSTIQTTGSSGGTIEHIQFESAGYAVSGTWVVDYDSGQTGTIFRDFSWNGTEPTSTNLKFRIRLADSQANLSSASWYPSGSYYESSEVDLSDVSANRWLQVEATLETSDISVTPTLTDIAVSYFSMFTSSFYNTNDAGNILNKISWTENLPTSTDIKFQIRSASDSSGSPGTSTDWCGPDDGDTSTTTCATSAYFTDSSGGESMDEMFTDGLNDQWVQYKVWLKTSSDGVYTPTLSEVTLTYVVNASPEFSTTSPATASQNETSNKVDITYSIRDPDTNSGSETPGYITPSFEYSLDGGSSWSTSSSEYFATNDWENKSVTTSTFNVYAAVWAAQTQLGFETNTTTAQVKVTVDDNEAANNTTFQTSSNFNLDTRPLSNLSSEQSTTTGKVVVDYDFTILSEIQASTTISLEYWNGSSWSSASTLEGDYGQGVASGAGKQILWNAKQDYSGIYTAAMKVRAIASYFETTQNLESSNFTSDTKNPALDASPISIDASQSPALVALSATDDSSFQMKVSLNADLSDGSWQSYNSTTTISLAIDPDTVYVQFKDAYNNTSTIQSATTPDTPRAMMIQDTSNMNTSPQEYRLFIAWEVISVPTPGFGKYGLYKSSDGVNYTLLATTSDINLNYHGDNNISSSTVYYYKVTGQDTDGNISYFSSIVNGLANGIQDYGEGGGGTDEISPIISNVATSSLTTNSITITWQADEISNSIVYYSATTSWPDTGKSSYDKNQGVPTMIQVGNQHTVTLSSLQTNTQYYYLVESEDPSDNSGTLSTQTYTFTTNPGPVITSGSVITQEVTNNTAKISWITNVNADSYVVYSTSSDLSNSQSHGSDALTANHSVTLPSLTQGTKYYYYVKSTTGGNTAYDKNVVDGVITYYTFTTSQDTTSPAISSISSSVSTSTANVVWQTDESADSQVDYGTTTSYGSTATSLTLTKAHVISLSDLVTSTTYHYRVISTDANSNTSTSTDQTFTTLFLSVTTENDTTPPAISNVAISTVSDTKATVTWTTDELSTSQVIYGTTVSYGSQTTKDTTLTFQHSDTISSLTKQTTYYYQVVSTDVADNTATSSDYTFITTDQPGIVETIRVGGGGVLYIEKEVKPDETPPIILSIEVKDISYTSVTITWRTNEATDSFVKYGKTTDYGNTAGNPEESKTSHSVSLASLTPGSTYHFKVFGKDSYGNLGSSADKTFTTLGIPAMTPEEAIPEEEKGLVERIVDILTQLTNPYSVAFVSEALEESAQRVVGPPLIAGEYPIVETGSDWARITWVTDKTSNSLVAYASEEDYDPTKEKPYIIVSGNPDEMVVTHIVELINLQPATLYHFQARSKGKLGDWAKSDDKIFTTLSLLPEISEVKFISIKETEAILTWLTTLPTKTKIELINTETGEKTSQEDPSFLKAHTFTLEDLQMATDYSLQITAQDERGNQSISSVLPFSTSISKNPPIIYNVRITTALIPGRIERVQAIIFWKTDKPSTSKVYYQEGITTKQELAQSTFLDKKLVLDHIVITTAFKPGKVYQFKTESIDSFNNKSYSKNYTILTPQPKESVLDLIIKNFEETFGFLKRLRF